VSSVESSYERVNEYTAVRIRLASPSDIRSWSFGEVKRAETINYRTFRPEKDGLFCERIFGPEKNYECSCGKYKGMKFKGIICDRCGVKVTESRVRRRRMGHIELAAPVVHIWFFKVAPSRIAALLDLKAGQLEGVIYYQDYIVIDPKDTPLQERQILTQEEYRQYVEEYGIGSFEADMGAEAIKKLLQRLNLVELSQELRRELETTESKQTRSEVIRRLKVVEALRDSENKPEWMVLECIPVIPPELRPLVALETGNFAISDLNDLYRRIINRNNRLKKLMDLNAPEVIIRNEKRMLQQSVDALFDNNRCKRPVMGSSNRPLKSLSDMIKGKQGRFRENLLGKRVDYSARSVIVVGPELQLHQCGLPKRIALELYTPFIIRRLKELGHADTIKSAKRLVEQRRDPVWDILDEVIRNHPVLLNRAPTLHRMGIQAFEPVLVEGNAIQIHPLVCKAFNADFDGDQMAVHLPLSIEAIVEAATLMLSTHNIFSPAHGNPIIGPSQDIVMGCYFASVILEGQPGEGKLFADPDEAIYAYEHGLVNLHARIRVRLPKTKERVVGEGAEDYRPGGIIETSVGRLLFNNILHERMPYYNVLLRSKELNQVIADCYELLGRSETIDLLDRMKEFGFRLATKSGLSFGTVDLKQPPNKQEVLERAEREVGLLHESLQRGEVTRREIRDKIIDIWMKASQEIKRSLMEALRNDERDGKPYINPIYLMAQSGARGNEDQVQQLAGMRGLMAKPSGAIIETPIKSSFREGLTVLEYFSSTHGARKGLADTALKTADSGYLTRKLADVAQNVVVTCYDCGTTNGITKAAVKQGDVVVVPLWRAIYGRVARSTIVDPVRDEVVVRENQLITKEIAKLIEEMGIAKIRVRSPVTCEAPLGVCQLCYGMDLTTGELVEQGLAVGIIAAQSIGEPGTQLTMRTFHIGGIARRRVEQSNVVSQHSGVVEYTDCDVVRVDQEDRQRLIVVGKKARVRVLDSKGRELASYPIPEGAEPLVEPGGKVRKGQVIAQWDPHIRPVVCEVEGRARFEDLVEGDTLHIDRDPATGRERLEVAEHRGDRQPAIRIEDPETGRVLDMCHLPERSLIEVRDGQLVRKGTILARQPQEQTGTQDITGGLPRVSELFDARRPKEPAVMAEIDGVVEVLKERVRGKRIVRVVNEKTGVQLDHAVPGNKPLRVRTGDRVRAGDPLCEGPLDPHDILRIAGEEPLQQYLLREIQAVYRGQGVEIDDKHVEIIIAQMLRKVMVEDPGDTNLLPETQIDRHQFQQINRRLQRSGKITDPGDTQFTVGEVVPLEYLEKENASVVAQGGEPAKWERPRPATARTLLLGITKAAVGSESFISAASFQETTRVLTEAAIAGKRDPLVGLKENVILGRLIPAGTGFKTYVQSDVRVSRMALEALEAEQPEIRPSVGSTSQD